MRIKSYKKAMRRALSVVSTAAVAISAISFPQMQKSSKMSHAVPFSGGSTYSANSNNGLKNVMYFGDWSIWVGQGNFYPDKISGNYLTHLNFSFLDFDMEGNLLFCDPCAVFGAPMAGGGAVEPSAYTKTLNWTAWSTSKQVGGEIGLSAGSVNAGIMPAFLELRRQYPNLRFGVSVGGWSKCAEFTPVAENKTTRAKLVDNLRTFLLMNDMDFIDLDWEYPGSRRAPDYKDNANDEGTPRAVAKDGLYFVELLEDIKVMQNELGKEMNRVYELSSALPSTVGGFMNGAQAFLPESILQDAYGSNWNTIPVYTNFNAMGMIAEGTMSQDGLPDRGKLEGKVTDEQWAEACDQYVGRMFKALDYANLMTYDMRGAFDEVSGHQSPLYGHNEADMAAKGVPQEAIDKNFSTDKLVRFLLGYKEDTMGNKLPAYVNTPVQSNKIMLGICIYTRGWENVNESSYINSTNPGLFQTAKRAYGSNGDEVGAQPAAVPANGDGGWLTGVYGYGQINEVLGATAPDASNDLITVPNRSMKALYNVNVPESFNALDSDSDDLYWDDVSKAEYIYNKNNGCFFTFDGPLSIAEKGNYIKQYKLGGMISWQASNDRKGSSGSKRDWITKEIHDTLWGSGNKLEEFNTGKIYMGNGNITATMGTASVGWNGETAPAITIVNGNTYEYAGKEKFMHHFLTGKDLNISALNYSEWYSDTIKFPNIYIKLSSGTISGVNMKNQWGSDVSAGSISQVTIDGVNFTCINVNTYEACQNGSYGTDNPNFIFAGQTKQFTLSGAAPVVESIYLSQKIYADSKYESPLVKIFGAPVLPEVTTDTPVITTEAPATPATTEAPATTTEAPATTDVTFPTDTTTITDASTTLPQATTTAEIGSFKKGDLNLDGSINTTDLTIMKRIVAKWADYSAAAYMEPGELNKDDLINTTDLTIHKRSVAKWGEYLDLDAFYAAC